MLHIFHFLQSDLVYGVFRKPFFKYLMPSLVAKVARFLTNSNDKDPVGHAG